MSDTGDESRVLGMQVTSGSQARSLTITQEDYTRGLLVTHGMQGCRPLGTPGYDKELCRKRAFWTTRQGDVFKQLLAVQCT